MSRAIRKGDDWENTMRSQEIDNSADIIDSRDIIARIDYLENTEDEDEQEELANLLKLQEQAEGCSDWDYGATLVRESYFTDHIEELIKDCYNMPEEMDSGTWPYNHLSMDYEAAAEEAKVDYSEVDFDGVTYYIRD